MSQPPTVAVCIVTHNSAEDLPACLASVGELDHRPLEIVLVDCASGDGSAEAARRLAPAGIPMEVVPLAANLGFAGGMNLALGRTSAPFVLLLNADARPSPDYVTRLLRPFLEGGEGRIGAATGRLLRFARGAGGSEGSGEEVLDACGMRLTLTWRHLDRGSGEPDRGQWGRRERVFGATGAASLFSRAALDDVAMDGEILDSAFHSFREDAELCFRLCERSWGVVYEPAAVARHRRWNVPRSRREMPPLVNFHSLKNRYLLRAYHQSGLNLLLTLIPALFRDLGALAYALVFERASLAAYAWVWRHRREIWARRRSIQRRKTCRPWALERWFFRSGEPP